MAGGGSAPGRGERRYLESLLPRPRRVELSGEVDLGGGRDAVSVRTVTDRSIRREGYRISIDADGNSTIAASDESGFFYGRATFDQLVRVHGAGHLPVGTVEDWPDLAVRGVMLDVSRTKVPTLETLFGIVDRLASWKVNHLELYMEHTFSYAAHGDVWAGADPYTARDMEELGAYCSARHVELVPNQNTLGHMERWLCHERYSALGIAKGVVKGPLGMPFPASTLDPTNPRSLDLVRELLGELGASVPSGRFHVGLDEPWELPAARHLEWGSWVRRLRSAPELEGREMLVWGDFLAAHPELLSALPDGLTVCEWGYEADHPFASRSEALSGAGVGHWLCPGTSSWLSILGRVSNAIDNCRAAAAAASSSGGDAKGMLVADWGDFGHLQYLPVSEPGMAAVAALSWCESSNRHLNPVSVAALLDLHCFDDPEGHLGAALVALGDAHTLLPCQFPNVSTLVLNLYFPQLPVGSGLTSDIEVSHLDLVESAIDDAVTKLGRARPATEHGRTAVAELSNSARLARVACRDARERLRAGAGGRLEDVAPRARAWLASELADVIAEHRDLWSKRNRRGGLEESCEWLEHLRRCYLAGATEPDWASPLVERIRRSEEGNR